uniref:Ig-like domain-containing protein n=1 Tax=Equus caballus TaxID=9796 RepID=F6W0Q5_HORSE
MAWVPLLLTLLAHCTGSTSQDVVIQESSLITTPGGTVTLTCGSSAGAVTSNNYANWVQEKPYQGRQGLIGGTSNRVSGGPCPILWLPALGNKAALTIMGAQPEDEDECYCALWFSNHFHNERYRWGSNTKTHRLSLALCS